MCKKFENFCRPLKFKSSEDTTFEVELRTWKPKEDFIGIFHNYIKIIKTLKFNV